jgi:hypothetical protein
VPQVSKPSLGQENQAKKFKYIQKNDDEGFKKNALIENKAKIQSNLRKGLMNISNNLGHR